MSNKTIVYVPNGAKINIENKSMDDPKKKYEKTKSRFDIDAVKKFIGGVYGRKRD